MEEKKGGGDGAINIIIRCRVVSKTQLPTMTHTLGNGMQINNTHTLLLLKTDITAFQANP